jgi:hypothetical protein
MIGRHVAHDAAHSLGWIMLEVKYEQVASEEIK